MYQLTQSSAMVGYIYLAEFVPMVCLAFVGGALADFLDKRQDAAADRDRADDCNGDTAGKFVAAATRRSGFCLLPWHCTPGFAAIQRPAFESFIQKVIPPEIDVGGDGTQFDPVQCGSDRQPGRRGNHRDAVQRVDRIYDRSCHVRRVADRGIHAPSVPPPENAERPSLQSIKRAWKYAFCRQELVGTYFIDIAAMFFAMPQALYPALAVIYGDKYVGFFPASIAAGALLASVTSGWTKNIHRHGLMVTIAAVLWGVAIIFFGLVDSIVPALLFLGAAGFFDMISGIFRGSIWNQTIPNYLRGRLASIEMMSYLTGPMLGSAKMGIVAEKFGVKAALISGGVLCVVSVVGAAVFLPKILRI